MGEHQKHSAVPNKEVLTRDPLLVYTKFGVFPLTTKDIQRRLENMGYYDNLQEIERPLYGLKLKKIEDDGVMVFVQTIDTYTMKRYLFAQIKPNWRLYVEKQEKGVSLFVVSANEDFDTKDLMRIIYG